jgi:hypothetical protein
MPQNLFDIPCLYGTKKEKKSKDNIKQSKHVNTRRKLLKKINPKLSIGKNK